MKILLNPENGATIRDVWLNGTCYFRTESGEEFKPGTVIQFDDNVAKFMIDTFGFLEELDFLEAEKYMKKTKDPDLKCDKCDFVTKVQLKMEEHKRKHYTDEKAAELGIPVIKSGVGNVQDAKDPQTAIDMEAKNSGLEGEGLVKERVGRPAVMR